MAVFNPTLITKKGHELIINMLQNNTTCEFFKVVVSDDDLTDINVEELENFENEVQTVQIQDIEKLNESTLKISAVIDNTNLQQGYFMKNIGLYARTEEGEAILYSVTTTKDADFMPPYNGRNVSSVVLEMMTVVSNSDNITLNIDNSSSVSIFKFDREIKRLESELSNKSNNDHIHENSSTTKDGFMSKEDKIAINEFKTHYHDNIYTIYISSTGNDENSGRSTSNAIRTITKANQLLTNIKKREVALIFVDGGEFDGNLNIEGKTYVRIQGKGDVECVINGNLRFVRCSMIDINSVRIKPSNNTTGIECVLSLIWLYDVKILYSEFADLNYAIYLRNNSIFAGDTLVVEYACVSLSTTLSSAKIGALNNKYCKKVVTTTNSSSVQISNNNNSNNLDGFVEFTKSGSSTLIINDVEK